MRVSLIAAFVALACCQAVPAQVRPAKNKDTPSNDKKPAAGTPKVGGKTLKEWRIDLSSEDPSKRAIAILAIMNFGEEARYAVPDILKCLQFDRDLSPRAKACLALRMMEIDDDDLNKVIDALATRLYFKNEQQAIIRYEAAVTLRRFAKDAQRAIPALINGTLDRTSWEIRHMCAATLWRAAMDPENGPDPRAVRAIISLLINDKNVYQVRLEAIIGLGSMGPPSDPQLAAQVIKLLEQGSISNNKALALWAYAGLVTVGDPKRSTQALGQIAKFLKHPELEFRVQAAGALGALGKRSKPRVKDLIAMLSDAETPAVSAAAAALAQINDKSDTLVDALLSLLKENAKDKLKDNASNDDKIAAFNAYAKGSSAVIALVNLKAGEARVIKEFDKLLERKELDLGMKILLEQALTAFKKQEKEKDSPKSKEQDKPKVQDKKKK